jgi:hypothetical protein
MRASGRKVARVDPAVIVNVAIILAMIVGGLIYDLPFVAGLGVVFALSAL